MVSDVADFMRKFGVDYDGPPRELPADVLEFRLGHMKEELREYELWTDPYAARGDEFQKAFKKLSNALDPNVVCRAEQLDALVDLVYVTLQTAHKQGFDFNEAWRRVHAANMQKEAHPEGKGGIRKPPGWVAPDHSDLV